MIPHSFASFATSWFPPSRHSSLTSCMGTEVENFLLPMNATISLQITHRKRMYLSTDDVTGFCSPILSYLTGNVLRAPITGGRGFDLPNKRQVKKFLVELFPTPKIHLLYIFSHVAKISTSTGSHRPLWRNFPEDISSAVAVNSETFLSHFSILFFIQ